jgi:hypothetical protein
MTCLVATTYSSKGSSGSRETWQLREEVLEVVEGLLIIVRPLEGTVPLEQLVDRHASLAKSGHESTQGG